ncbi:hypothetical protein GOBAR_AA01903 [Gossypium barbadense]|uniref:Uncharacterized protein n=1 Tax=Gossypium barbadense TaxID=3634 RepID=A0A2P5YT02_GOSBA|nr:hypothetical protein GOBAR_AA01903 [Gossypium barbadense]
MLRNQGTCLYLRSLYIGKLLPIKQQFDSGLPCQIKDGNLASTLSIPHHYQRDLRGIFMYFLMEDKNGVFKCCKLKCLVAGN